MRATNGNGHATLTAAAATYNIGNMLNFALTLTTTLDKQDEGQTNFSGQVMPKTSINPICY